MRTGSRRRGMGRRGVRRLLRLALLPWLQPWCALAAALYSMQCVLTVGYCLQGVFVHSRDEQFDRKGAKSGFAYAAAFAWYKQLILQALVSGGRLKEKMLALFAWHNGHIFPASQSGGSRGADGAEGIEDQLGAALGALKMAGSDGEESTGSAWADTSQRMVGDVTGGIGVPSGDSQDAYGFWVSNGSEDGSQAGSDVEDIPFFPGEGAQVISVPSSEIGGGGGASSALAWGDEEGEGEEAGAGGAGGLASSGADGDEAGGTGVSSSDASKAAAPPHTEPNPAPAKKTGKAKAGKRSKALPPQTPRRRGRSAVAAGNGAGA